MAMNVAGSAGGKGRAAPSINVTPLVDIVLVVLIIFMIVTLMATKTFWLYVPPKEDEKAEKPPPGDIKPVVMTVDRAGAIHVNNTPLAKKDIAARLPRILAGAGQRVLYFDAHDEASYAAAIEAMDLSRASGVRSIAILTKSVIK